MPNVIEKAKNNTTAKKYSPQGEINALGVFSINRRYHFKNAIFTSKIMMLI